MLELSDMPEIVTDTFPPI